MVSRIFWAENRGNGKRWMPALSSVVLNEYLVLYDSGKLAIVTDCGYSGTIVSPLDSKVWKLVFRNEDIKL